MNAVKNFFLVFKLFFMIPIVMLIQVETTILNTVLNGDFYTSTFKHINLYEKIAGAILEKIELEVRTKLPENTALEFTERFGAALDKLAETQFKDNISAFRSYLFFGQDVFELNINLKVFKDEISESFINLPIEQEKALISYFINMLPDNIDLSEFADMSTLSNQNLQREFNQAKFVLFIPFFFLPFFLIFYLILSGIDKGLIWFSSGLIASGLILAFIIIFSFTGINTQIENGVRSIAENSEELYELFYNLAISFINSVRNTGFIFAGVGVIIIVAIKIKRENEKPDIKTEGQNSEF